MKPDKIYLSLTLLILLTAFSWFTSCTHVANIANIPEVCFTGDVLPIFINNCAIQGCHDGRGETRLTLNNYADITNIVTPGNPDASRGYQTIIAKTGQNMMPPNQPLSLTNRTIIRLWIEQGAAETTCPGSGGNGGGTGGGGSNYVARACFTRDILPVLVSRCATTNCHDGGPNNEGYNYTSYAGTIRSVSELYQVINLTSGESKKMPPTQSPQLSTAEIDSIGKWIGYGALNENCGEVCDTINPVTFSQTIWPIMQTSCTGCHTGASPGGGIVLANYANVQVAAANGSLMNSLRGNGVSKMPKGGSFSACRIRQFDLWVKNGFSNN